MTALTATRVAASSIDWPEPVAIADDRVLAGSPVARTLVLHDEPTHQMGMWNITAGEFTTDHVGYLEFIHIIDGKGQLIAEDGTTTDLESGVTVLMQPGWKGRWSVLDTITKVYTIAYA